MNALGALPLDRGGARLSGVDCHRPDRTVRHQLLAEGGVRIILPRGGKVSDAQARRLAWAILADLAPDEIVPAAVVVTYKEAQRLAVLRAVAGGALTAATIADALGWSLRSAQRRALELVGDGRLAASHAGPGGCRVQYSLQLNQAGA